MRSGSLSFMQPDEPLKIVTDPRRVRQILLNLLSNAIKFGMKKPIRVSCAKTADGGVRISVRDEGEGISKEDQSRIFEEFVQVSLTQHMGTGLGLPISRRLATLLDGSLDVESTPGVGSVFTLILPAEGKPRIYDPEENQVESGWPVLPTAALPTAALPKAELPAEPEQDPAKGVGVA